MKGEPRLEAAWAERRKWIDAPAAEARAPLEAIRKQIAEVGEEEALETESFTVPARPKRTSSPEASRLRGVGTKQLDRRQTPERAMAHGGDVDGRHSALAEPRQEPVFAE